MLTQAVEFDPDRANEVDMHLRQLPAPAVRRADDGLLRLALRRSDDDKAENKSGTYALHTLKDDETIARLATGIKRFTLPDEFNWIKIYQRVAGRGKSTFGEQARDTLASDLRGSPAVRQGGRRLEEGHRGIRPGPRQLSPAAARPDRRQLGPLRDRARSQPAGSKRRRRFPLPQRQQGLLRGPRDQRAKLLDDVKAYLKSNPGQLDWNKLNIGNIGYRLVEQNQKQYLGDKVAAWDLDLKPRPDHVDDRITVTTPLTKPGAYLLTAQMADGNVSRIIVWVSDTVIVKKQLDGKVLLLRRRRRHRPAGRQGRPRVLRLETGAGRSPTSNDYRVETTAFSDTTDDDGQVILGQARRCRNDYQWLVTARKAKDGDKDGATASPTSASPTSGTASMYDPEYNQTKVFTITDRPVYRPEQTVQFKVWVRHAKYDQPDTSDFADQTFTVQIHNPQGREGLREGLTADDYGGLAGEFPLAKGAMLGIYSLQRRATTAAAASASRSTRSPNSR